LDFATLTITQRHHKPVNAGPLLPRRALPGLVRRALVGVRHRQRSRQPGPGVERRGRQRLLRRPALGVRRTLAGLCQLRQAPDRHGAARRTGLLAPLPTGRPGRARQSVPRARGA
jgi:hypothetical protein